FGGIGLLGKYLILGTTAKYIVTFVKWGFGIIMVKLYAPADTENVPIISEKERKKKRILSYITLTLSIIIALFIKNEVISNIIIFG
ncbi:accessory gene regulator B family protein, partial [Escherichia coli]|uniref:accessory gene regulator B family protein n=1 Tax=Escherichia coli TaxID=562 RepID=UPI00390CAE9D